MNKWYFLIIFFALAGAGWWFVREVKERIPAVEDQSVAYPDLGRDHIPVGSEHPAYNSNPPSSGWHYAETAKLGFYDVDEPAPADENLIHNLEHGEIWIAYRPSISDAYRERLRQEFGSEPLVIITPRAVNDTDIALVAWGRVYKWDLPAKGGLGEQRIRDFITRWRNRGPEKVPPSAHQSR